MRSAFRVRVGFGETSPQEKSDQPISDFLNITRRSTSQLTVLSHLMSSLKSKIPDRGQDAQNQILELQQGQELQGIKTNGNQHFDTYQTSLTTRYCSAVMSYLFSQRSRCSTWRTLWLHLAEAERALGIDTITLEALDEMRAHLHLTDSDFEIARTEEKRRRHVRSVSA